MATAKNKLPTFGTNASVDSSIVNGSSELANTGFQANTIIRSAQVNTYLKILMNNINGLIDAIYNEGAAQGEISGTSSSEDVKNYITAGLSKIIAGTKVDSAVHADEATNVDAITNNDDGDNANVKFSIGEQNFSKTVNNVAHATNAEKLDSVNIGSATQPVYFDADGKPTAITGDIGNGTTGNAASATKLQTARKISLTGDATGEVNFDGTEDVTITADVISTANVDSITNNDGGDNANVNFNIGDKNFTKTVNNVAHATNADNATNATNATTASKLGTDAGTINNPVYFKNGVPVAITGIDKSTKLVYTATPPGLQQNPTFDDIFYFNTIATDYAPIAQRAAKLTLRNSGIGGIITYGDANVGNAKTPVYFEDGVPKVCTTENYDVMTYDETPSVTLSGLTTNNVNAGVRVTLNKGLSFGSVYVAQMYTGSNGVFGILVVTAQDGRSGYFFGHNATTNTQVTGTVRLLGSKTPIVALKPTN